MPIARLPEFSYQGQYAYFITLTCFKRRKNFAYPKLIRLFIKALRQEAEQQSFLVLAFCFMPDHVHLLLKGENPSSDLRKFIKLFKQKTGYIFKKACAKPLWQRSYYDHVVRDEENIDIIVHYIMNNPVKAGLVKNWQKYEWTGSFTLDLKSVAN